MLTLKQAEDQREQLLEKQAYLETKLAELPSVERAAVKELVLAGQRAFGKLDSPPHRIQRERKKLTTALANAKVELEILDEFISRARDEETARHLAERVAEAKRYRKREGEIYREAAAALEQFLDIFAKHRECQQEFEGLRMQTESELPRAGDASEWNEVATPLVRPVPVDVRAFFKTLYDVCAESLNGTRETGGLRADEDEWLRANTPDLRSKNRKLTFDGRRDFDIRSTGT